MLIKKRHIKYIFFFFILSTINLYGQVPDSLQLLPRKGERDSLTAKLPVISEKLGVAKDSIASDSISVPPKKEALTDIIEHSADDSIRIDIKKNRTILYNNAKLRYQDINLEAGIITIDYKKELIIARGIKDSTEYKQLPYFKQGQEESIQDSLIVNYDTEKALIWGLRSEQTNGVLISSNTSKKVNDSTVYVRDIVITTSKKKQPDYHILIKKAKVVPNKKIVAGISQLFIADVPTAVALPFAYFPLTEKRTSGILMPTWGENGQQGYFLQNGGYYLAISDYFDLALTGDIYTNGSWGFRSQSNYALRYKFSGNFNFNYDNNVFSLRGLSDYSKSVNYNIRWSHSQDAAANPNARLSASVNLGSSKYYRESLNEYNTSSFLNNNLSSSISFSKRFVGTPFNLSMSATHSQVTNTESITMSLPALRLSMDRIYPFAPKSGTKKNALQKTGLSYNLAGDYRINTTDEHFFKKEMFEGAKSGVRHTVGLNTNMKVFTYFTLNPSVNYKEVWYFDSQSKYYDPDKMTIVTDTVRGFNAYREYNAGISLSTNIYGTYNFKKGRLKAIRHTIRPSISYGYRPDFSFYDREVLNQETGEIVTYSPYQGGIYGSPGKGITNSISISCNNTFEAKVMPRDSTETEAKKIKLLNNLNFSTSYNIAADTLRWAPINMSGGTQILNDKMRINFNATFDPYAINANGTKINKFNIANEGSLLRLTSAGITMNYSLSNDTFSGKDKREEDENKKSGGATDSRDVSDNKLLGGNLENTLNPNSDTRKVKKTKLYFAKIPWNLSLSYSLNYSNMRREKQISNHSLMVSGNIELSPKWSVGFSSGYDFKSKGVTYTQLRFQRDLDSWKMSFNWVPFGIRSTYYFFVGVKSSVLSEIKYDKRSPNRRLF